MVLSKENPIPPVIVYLLIAECKKNCYQFSYLNRIACQYLHIVLLLWNYLCFKLPILMNSVFRPTFGFNKWESSVFINCLWKLDFIYIPMKLMLKFYNSLVQRQDTVWSICVKLFQLRVKTHFRYNILVELWQMGESLHLLSTMKSQRAFDYLI